MAPDRLFPFQCLAVRVPAALKELFLDRQGRVQVFLVARVTVQSRQGRGNAAKPSRRKLHGPFLGIVRAEFGAKEVGRLHARPQDGGITRLPIIVQQRSEHLAIGPDLMGGRILAGAAELVLRRVGAEVAIGRLMGEQVLHADPGPRAALSRPADKTQPCDVVQPDRLDLARERRSLALNQRIVKRRLEFLRVGVQRPDAGAAHRIGNPHPAIGVFRHVTRHPAAGREGAAGKASELVLNCPARFRGVCRSDGLRIGRGGRSDGVCVPSVRGSSLELNGRTAQGYGKNNVTGLSHGLVSERRWQSSMSLQRKNLGEFGTLPAATPFLC